MSSKRLDFKHFHRPHRGSPVCLAPPTETRKSHPLEGSCQEATPLPSTTFDIFSRCVLLGTLHPRLAISDAAVFSLSWRRLLCAAPVTHQDQGLLMSRCCARHLPLASSCPRKPSVPYRVQFCTAYRSHGSLTGPTLTGLTAEASHHSAMRWQAICDGLRPGLIRWNGYEPTFPPASGLNPTAGQTSAKRFRCFKGHQVSHHVITRS
jgi:hypothetical protein